MRNAHKFREKMDAGRFLLGTCLSYTDPAVAETLGPSLDFLWLDAEHNAYSNETIYQMAIASTACETPMLVRVAWNDPVLIKPVLDCGVDGIVVPMIRTAEDVRGAVAACLYPPQGIRGFGPRRPSNYGRDGGPDYIRRANESIIVIVQIEHIDAVNNIDEILKVPGLTTVLIGPNDLSGSMGLLGNPRHPDVVKAVQTVIDKANAAGKHPGLASGGPLEALIEWIEMGIQWMPMSADFILLRHATEEFAARIREHVKQTR